MRRCGTLKGVESVQSRVSQARLLSAARNLRRSYRAIITAMINDIELDLESRFGGHLPISSTVVRLPNGSRAAEAELVDMLREATNGGRYSLPGRRILSRSGGIAIDELTSRADFRDRDPETVVKELAASIDHARRLRGRGGRYGCIGSGLSGETYAEVALDSCDDVALESIQSLLLGMLEDAAQRLGHQVQFALQRYDQESEQCFQRYFQVLASEKASDADYREIFEPEHQSVLDLVMTSRLSWKMLAAEKLGLERKSPSSRKFLPIAEAAAAA